MSFGPGAQWLLGGLVLLIGEIVLPGFFLFWIGLAALGTGGIVLAASPDVRVAVAVFVALTAASVLAGAALRRRARAHAPPPVVNLAGSGLVGRAAVVTAIEPGGLRVRVGDSDWSARADAPAAVGATLTVRAVDGIVLLVE